MEEIAADEKSEPEPDYSRWTVDEDGSIKAEDGYGIEIISPVLLASVRSRRVSPGDWETELQKVWALIENYFDVVTEYRHQCGTHIHLSPLGGFDAEQVRSFACFITCLSDQISQDIPPERKMSDFAPPNFEIRPRPSLSTLAPGTSINQLVEYMMPREEDRRRAKMGEPKYVAWNFLPLLGPKGTIEFRQPPHVKNFEEAMHWVTTALLLGRQGLRWTR